MKAGGRRGARGDAGQLEEKEEEGREGGRFEEANCDGDEERKDLQHGKRMDEERGKDTRKTSAERTTTGGSSWRRVPPGGHPQRVNVRCEAEPRLKPDYNLQSHDCTRPSVQAR